MAAVPDLEAYLGKNIDVICRNRLHDPNLNHCAHFVSHAVGLTFSFNCRQFAGGSKPAGNIRVHEIFANCPRVGIWDAANNSSRLIFVTRKDVVNIATKTMQNIPEKHIGIYHDGAVYHYSNANDRVVKQSVADFFAHFQAAYAGDQGLFFGEFPNSDLMLTVDVTAAAIAHPYRFALRKTGNKWFAKRSDVAGAAEFLAGVEVNQPAKNFFGLGFPVASYYGPSYDLRKHIATIDHWAYLLDVTAYGEGKNRFNLINSYDRAQFTYGFYQLAAHTPRDNLILFFREALLDDNFQQLFPDLKLIGGKVFRVAQDGTTTDLEEEFYDPATKEMQLKRFMTYLNPERMAVDQQEVLQAARLVWWANESPESHDIQVKVANSILQRKFTQRYNAWYDLDGKLDVVCAIIADIHHQARGSKTAVKAALATGKIAALLAVGKDEHPERVKSLAERIKKWTDAGKMGRKKYRASLNQFE